MKTGSIVLLGIVGFVLLWLYEANPGNLFQRGTQGAPNY
jgi:hypothetical protein